MTKKSIVKITYPKGILAPADLTADEKRALYSLFAGYELTEATAYNRLFVKGFDEWELRGINDIKREFCDRYALNNLRNTGEGFYSALTANAGLKTALVNQMTILGMEHRITVARRFDADDWRPWERIGIRAIVNEFATTVPDNDTAAMPNSVQAAVPDASPSGECPAVFPQQECPAVSTQE